MEEESELGSDGVCFLFLEDTVYFYSSPSFFFFVFR